MKTYELNAGEIDMVVDALLYATNYGCPLKDEEMRALIDRLNPKPVKKNAWMMVYPDESRSRLFDTETDAKEWANHAPVETKVVKVTWEE
jgi:hypothetical protein